VKIIKVLGTGCSKCKSTVANVNEAVKQSGIEAEVIKIEDIKEIMKYNVMSTPAVVIDEEVKTKGKIPTVEELKMLLA
jgi:small redox-active disulfide protein 2